MKRYDLLFFGLLLAYLLHPGAQTISQESESRILVVVNMVQLNVAVTDEKGNYVTGLRPEDFTVFEDGISERIATFGEGNEPTLRLLDSAGGNPSAHGTETHETSPRTPSEEATFASSINGANVFILFDTSNYMYRQFVFAQDAIADFVRALEPANKIALYAYSRDLSRASRLTADRFQVLRGIRATVAGDDAALYNALLLTVKDAALCTGRKVVVVFSNGPDNASTVPPEDVAELGQSSGVSIYMISTQQARLDPVSTAVFERMTAGTGGKAYFAKSWRDQEKAFGSIRDDLAHLYSITYYSQPNPNRGWRTISVRLSGERLKKCHIRTRNGYRPQPVRFLGNATVSPSQPAPQ